MNRNKIVVALSLSLIGTGLPSSLFAQTAPDGAAERAKADSSWMDGVKPSAPSVAATGAEALSGSKIDLAKAAAASPSGQVDVPAPKTGRSIDDVIDEAKYSEDAWWESARWHTLPPARSQWDELGGGKGACWGNDALCVRFHPAETLGGSLWGMISSLALPPVAMYYTAKTDALKLYRDWGLVGAVAGAIGGTVIGAVRGACGAAAGVVANVGTAGYQIYKAADHGFRWLFGLKS